MSTKFRDKNLLFYRKEDSESNQFLAELAKNQPLKSQFILINQNDPRLSLPPSIAKLDKPLILIAHGVNEPIIGKDALFWLKNNGFVDKGNGFEYMNLGGGGQLGAFIDENAVDNISSTRYSLIGEKSGAIDTFEDSGRKVKTSEFDQKLSRLKHERDELNQAQRGQRQVF
jgi:hypothetical protein